MLMLRQSKENNHADSRENCSTQLKIYCLLRSSAGTHLGCQLDLQEETVKSRTGGFFVLL